MRRLVKTTMTLALAGVALAGTATITADAHAADKWRTVGTTPNGLGIQANQHTTTNFALHAGMATQNATKKRSASTATPPASSS